MAPITAASDPTTHNEILNRQNMHDHPKRFRNSKYKPNHRRNKNIKQINSEAQRTQQSMMNTQQNSGASTPQLQTDGTNTPNLKSEQANQDLSRGALQNAMQLNGSKTGARTPGTLLGVPGIAMRPKTTYTSIAAAPSLKPRKNYCDIVGKPAKYKDPKTGLHYCNAEVYKVVTGLTTGQVQEYLAIRGANTILK